MNWKSKYNIEFKGLKEGLHDFEFEIDKLFFEHFEDRLVDNGEVTVKVILEKRSTFLKLQLKIGGWLELTCDRCLDNYNQPIENEAELFVKFGETKYEDAENVIWVDPEEHVINLAQVIYEYASLSIPLRHIHPKNKEGKRECNKEMLKKLKGYMHTESAEEPKTDPRWDALKGLGYNN
ncbi:MAG: DUF177 domain-containing protein [Draconibacterium sp.]